MSRKDYIAIADAFKREYESISPYSNSAGHIRVVANNIASYLAQDNESFQKERFINACGMPWLLENSSKKDKHDE